MGRKVLFNVGTRDLAIIILAVSLIITTGCLGLFENDNDDDDDDSLIPDHPQIVTVEGIVDDEGNISIVLIDVDLYGDQGVDMRNIVMHIIATPSNGPAESCDLIYGPAGSIDDENYGVRELFDPNNTWNPEGTPASYIFGKECLLELQVNLTASAVPLPPDSTLEIVLAVTISGHDTYDHFRTPTAYPATGTVRLED